MNNLKKLSKKNLASEKLCCQIWGATLKRWWLSVLFIVGLIPKILYKKISGWMLDKVVPYSSDCFNKVIYFIGHFVKSPWYGLLLLTLFVWLIIAVCRFLTNIFNLRKLETGITWCQISILIAIGLWIIGFLLVFNIQKDSQYFVALGIVGSLIAWIFQDNIKGAVAFIHLRINNLLCIDDWIVVPAYSVDGEIKRVTLTTVTVYNWDTTTSCFPTSTLYTGHFINKQKMTEGKTYGRQMLTTFTLDTGWFHTLSSAEAEQLKLKMKATDSFKYLPENEIREGELNAKLYRMYLYHWMMNYPHVSQMPRLMVRWLQQKESGMPLQVYAYITEGSVAAFEWQHSQIIEHILTSMEWFGLQLYQSPSGYDTSNGNVHLTDKPASYRKEADNE